MPARVTLLCDVCGSSQLIDLIVIEHMDFKTPAINLYAPPGWQIAFLRTNGKRSIVCVCSDSCKMIYEMRMGADV
jgi:hypothetical protein